MTTSVLIIDDQFMDVPPLDGVRIHFVRDVPSAKYTLGIQSWQQVWWDFDLGGENTSLDIIKWMKEEAGDKRPSERFRIDQCVVHSKNPIGAVRLLHDLGEMGYKVYRSLELPGVRHD